MRGKRRARVLQTNTLVCGMHNILYANINGMCSLRDVLYVKDIYVDKLFHILIAYFSPIIHQLNSYYSEFSPTYRYFRV